MKAIYKRYVTWSKSIVDIRVSNTEKSKNNLEKYMKSGSITLAIFFITISYILDISNVIIPSEIYSYLRIVHFLLHSL